MSQTTKVMVDVDGGNNMLYIPLDRMMQQAATMPLVTDSPLAAPTRSGTSGTIDQSNQRQRSSLRTREAR